MAIHLFAGDGKYSIWTDCEPGHLHSGRCIGTGSTFKEARTDAISDLHGDLAALEVLTEADAETDAHEFM